MRNDTVYMFGIKIQKNIDNVINGLIKLFNMAWLGALCSDWMVALGWPEMVDHWLLM